MSSSATAPVVVGYDGSPASAAALRWAGAYADHTGAAVRVVHALALPLVRGPAGYTSVVRVEDLIESAEVLLDHACEQLRADHPDLGIDVVVNIGAAGAILLEEAGRARLVVVGSSGLGEFRDSVLGSVAAQLAIHASTPVVVVPAGWRPGAADRRIVVGVDGSKLSTAAIDFAFDYADAARTSIEPVLAWRGPVSAGPGDMLPLVYEADELQRENEVILAENLAGRAERYPDVVVWSQVVRGDPAAVLLEAARGAELLVVGSRGRGGFRGLLLGSVSWSVLHRCACPVAVVR